MKSREFFWRVAIALSAPPCLALPYLPFITETRISMVALGISTLWLIAVWLGYWFIVQRIHASPDGGYRSKMPERDE